MKKIENPGDIIPAREAAIAATAEKYAEYSAETSCGRTEDEYFMDCALELAAIAGDGGEVPVGCVIVRGGRIVSVGANGREVYRDATYHAECAAISAACRALGGWRAVGCTMYVTLEPCPMCAGAAFNARMPRIVIGARDPRSGAMGSAIDVGAAELNHRPEIVFGVKEAECAELLRRFFRERR